MKRIVTCPKCGAVCQYDDSSVFLGQRDKEEVLCPECMSVLATVVTDQIPVAQLIKKGSIK